MGDLFISVSRERTNERTNRPGAARSAEATDGNTRFICKFHICRRERRRPPCHAAPSLLERSHGGLCESASLPRGISLWRTCNCSMCRFILRIIIILYHIKRNVFLKKKYFLYILMNCDVHLWPRYSQCDHYFYLLFHHFHYGM